jgi:hypothetical protein
MKKTLLLATLCGVLGFLIARRASTNQNDATGFPSESITSEPRSGQSTFRAAPRNSGDPPAILSSPTFAPIREEKRRSLASKLLREPLFQQMMADQQLQIATKASEDAITSSLADDLKLSPAQIEKLRELAGRRATVGWQGLSNYMAEELTEAEFKESGRRTHESLVQIDEELRQLLGAEGYELYREQERQIAAARNFQEIERSLNESGLVLDEGKRQRVWEAFNEETKQFRFSRAWDDPVAIDFENLPGHFSEANIDQFAAEKQQLNDRIAARIESTLAPEEWRAWTKKQKDDLTRATFTAKFTTALLEKTP